MGVAHKSDKPFMTYEQQINKLQKEKKLEIDNYDYAVRLLKEHSYFALISGYKEPFKGKDGNYKVHVSIEDIYALYVFDDSLRALILQYILKIEKHVKSLISYSFCEAYGEEQQHYLNVTKYNYNSKNQEEINELITRLTKITTDPKNYPYIKHQIKMHGNIPLWVMMKALTLGTVSKMYSFLPQSIQHNVSKEFEYVHESMLVQMLDLLARVRNVCAHNERLFDYKYKKGIIDDTAVHAYLNIPKKNGKYIKGKNDLFAVVIVLKYLLNDSDFNNFIEKLNKIIKGLLCSTRQIPEKQLYKYMGFPERWMKIAMKYDYVIFDVDGTLLNTTEGVVASVRHTIEATGLPKLSEEKLLTFIGPPIQDSFHNHYGIEGEKLQELATIFRNEYKGDNLLKAFPYEGIYEVCEELMETGVKIGVATYKRQDYAERILKHFGFDKYSKYLYGADHENKLKKMDIIKLCMDEMGVTDKKQVLMIGDSSHDAIGAEKIGVDFLGVTYGFDFRTKEDVKKYPAIGAADTPMEILQYII